MAKVAAPKTAAAAVGETPAVVLAYKAARKRPAPAKATLRRAGRERQAVAAAR
jgi:hypothetical protein